jgi:O-antigen ligase
MGLATRTEAPRVQRPTPSGGSYSDDTGAHRGPPPELIALAVLLLLTAAFGRSFSKLELGPGWLHPTEVVLAAVLVAALARATPAEWVRQVRATGALVPLLVLWLFGAIAALRGLSDWGFSDVLPDIGLVEYSVLIPLLALVVRDRFDLFWLSRVVALGGVLAIAAQAAALWAPSVLHLDGRLELIQIASGLYVGVYATWVAARVAAGVSLAAWHFPILVLGIALTIAGAARAAWVGLLVGLVVVIVLAPSGRRLVVTGFTVGVLLIGAAVSVPVESPEGIRAPRVVSELQESFNESGKGGQSGTARWRLAFWGFALEESARSPLLGIGFGTPSDFEFAGTTYDTRTADTKHSITPPHNSFINLLYRAGLPALLALAALMFVAARRLSPVARSVRDEDRALAVWLLAAVATTTAVACFFTVLESPYMAIFFWTALGLALLAPQMLSPEPRTGSSS